jgi:hypothetical protein
MTTRTMRPPLDAWLAALSPVERRVMARLAIEDGHSELVSGLLRAIGAEILADVAREADVLRQLEADHTAYVEDVASRAVWPNGDPQPPTGPAATFDPDTRTWTFDND